MFQLTDIFLFICMCWNIRVWRLALHLPCSLRDAVADSQCLTLPVELLCSLIKALFPRVLRRVEAPHRATSRFPCGKHGQLLQLTYKLI